MRIEIGIDVNDIEQMADFWQLALAYKRGSGDGKPYLALVSPDGTGPVVFLQQVPEPKTVKDRLHLDIYADDPEPWIERLIAAGGTRLEESVTEGEWWWQVMADPEGNEFCVCKET